MKADPVSPWPRLAAWGVWLAMLASGLAFVSAHSSQVPFGDDWDYIERIAGSAPVTPSWLWEEDYGYRAPLPRLAIVGLIRLGGGNMALPRYFNLLVMALAAALLMRAAARLRGEPAWTDAFFPLLLMHTGHSRLLLQYVFVSYSLTALLLSVCIAAAAQARERGGMTASVIALPLLPLCGALGVAAAPPLAAWIWRAGRAREGASVTLTAVFIAAYFIGLKGTPDVPLSLNPASVLDFAFRFTGMGAGPVGRLGWPWVPAAIILAVAVTLALTIRRERFSGIALAMLACLAMAAAAGVGRASQMPDRDYIGLLGQYVTSASPLLAAAYLASINHGEWGRRAQALFFAAMLVALPFNARHAEAEGAAVNALEKGMYADINRGCPPREVAARHWPWFLCREGRMAGMMETLQDARLGPYRHGPGK